jgi:hypothetical protein
MLVTERRRNRTQTNGSDGGEMEEQRVREQSSWWVERGKLRG